MESRGRTGAGWRKQPEQMRTRKKILLLGLPEDSRREEDLTQPTQAATHHLRGKARLPRARAGGPTQFIRPLQALLMKARFYTKPELSDQ